MDGRRVVPQLTPLPPRPSFFVIERVKIIHRKGINLITVTRDLCGAAKWSRYMIGPCWGYLSRLSQHEWSYPDKSTSRLCPFVNRPEYPGVVIKTPDQYLVFPPLRCLPPSTPSTTTTPNRWLYVLSASIPSGRRWLCLVVSLNRLRQRPVCRCLGSG